ncbi:hypothetical protein SB763_35715, partial [Burkholderia sp. SIMBA_042]|uniref:hypothetical protein n=1 Tax=Burkholderia sp. SIMBA_042 TaxID=3085783 RepID=UPI00397BA567
SFNGTKRITGNMALIINNPNVIHSTHLARPFEANNGLSNRWYKPALGSSSGCSKVFGLSNFIASQGVTKNATKVDTMTL